MTVTAILAARVSRRSVDRLRELGMVECRASKLVVELPVG